MRWGALLVAGLVGLACCVISLIDARGEAVFGPEAAKTVHQPVGMPHLMRGWARTPPTALWWPAGP
jgi:hypothetical protein